MGSRAMFIDAISFLLFSRSFVFFVSGTCQLYVMMMNWISFFFAFICILYVLPPQMKELSSIMSIGIKDISIWSIGKLRQIYWINKLVSFSWQ